MKEFASQNKWFTYPYLILILLIAYFLVVFTKAEIHLYINQYHSSFFDVFFKYITNMGDGIFIPVYLLILAMIRFRYAVLLIIVFLLSGLVVQVLKRSFFMDIVRPTEFFKDIANLYLVPGVKQHCCRSFPSGHTATAFSSMVCFVIALKPNYAKVLCLVLACLIAFSRVYLSQHFLIDIFAGSLIGTLVAIYSGYFLNKVSNQWIDLNLLQILKRKKPDSDV
jgi:membrane-associated phospholipid phosphatase